MNQRNFPASDTVVKRVEELVSADMDGETVMMSIENGKYFGMDPIGSRIWELIEQPRSVSEVCAILLDEFDVEPEQCERDVGEFLNELMEQNISRWWNASGAQIFQTSSYPDQNACRGGLVAGGGASCDRHLAIQMDCASSR